MNSVSLFSLRLGSAAKISHLCGSSLDVIINVADSTCLCRSLYLTLQILELGIPIILALNMADEALKQGIAINCRALESVLSIPGLTSHAERKADLARL